MKWILCTIPNYTGDMVFENGAFQSFLKAKLGLLKSGHIRGKGLTTS